MSRPDLSIIIVNWNTRELTANCLRSILATAGDLAIEIIIVDNASSDDSQQLVCEQFPQVTLIENAQNVGFARANNQGLGVASGRYLLLLNSDALVRPGSLQIAIRSMDEHPEAGLAGAKLLNPDGSFQASYANFPTLKSEFLTATGLGARLVSPYYPSPRPHSEEGACEVDWVAGAFMLLRQETYTRVGGMDERYHMYSEETDWCYRIRQAGWRIYYFPQVEITHIGGASTRQRHLEMVAQLNKSKIQFFALNYGSTRAAQLRMLLSSIFLLRQLASRCLSLISSPTSADRWRTESERARFIRTACAQVNIADR